MLTQKDKERNCFKGSINDIAFTKFIWVMGGIDLDFVGNKFTWDNMREGRGAIREHLDRVICNGKWRMDFLKSIVIYLSTSCSNHCLLLLTYNHDLDYRPRPFRFILA